jgi:cytochrome c biogenesis protein CcmG/thiol:disulfide interchange protein DsbE
MTASPLPTEAPPTRRRTALWAAAAVGVLLAFLIGVLATRDSAADKLANSPLLGRAAPAISGTTLDGERLDLASLRGRWVVLNFVASWCVPCRQEHPELVAFDTRHRAVGDGQVLGVVFSDKPANVREFFREQGGDWPVLEDPQGQIALEFGVRGPPESFVIDPSGMVVAKITGPATAAGLERILESSTEAAR